MFFCPDCHVSNRPDAKFCRKCGKSRSDLERAEVAVAVVIPDQIKSAPDAADSASGAEDSASSAAGSVPNGAASLAAVANSKAAVANSAGAANSDPGMSGSYASTANSDPVVANSVPDSMDFAVEEVQRDDEILDHGVATDAPQLSINIEQEESLNAPPDLNTPECPSCWKALRATDKFCCWCGEAQPNRVLPFLKLCLECSTFLPEKANYCYSCGTDVGYSSRRKVRVPHELFKDEDSEFFPRFDA
jgi:hypothetical protein